MATPDAPVVFAAKALAPNAVLVATEPPPVPMFMDVVGRVTTVLPAIAGAWSVTEPLVSPLMTMLDIFFP
jgi:hypothetical protein